MVRLRKHSEANNEYARFQRQACFVIKPRIRGHLLKTPMYVVAGVPIHSTLLDFHRDRCHPCFAKQVLFPCVPCVDSNPLLSFQSMPCIVVSETLGAIS